MKNPIQECYLKGKEKICYTKNDHTLNRRTALFIHGLGGSSSAWKRYEKKFENEFNTLSFDLRGHGKSFRPSIPTDYTIDKFSNDLYKIIKKERLHKIILVSHSFGNLITLHFIKHHQNLVKAIILVSADASPEKMKRVHLLSPLFMAATLFDYIPQIKKTGRHVDYKKYSQTGDFNIRRMTTDIINTGIRSYALSMKQVYAFDIENFLTKIKIPALIIHGDKDKIFPPASGIKISKAIKGSQFILFRGSDHILIFNTFDKLATEIERFIKSLK